MACLVLKFGGTSVSDIERIRNAARRVAGEAARGHRLVVVVSAMSGVTNELVRQVTAISPLYDAAEHDAVVASGEQVTSGLMALTLQEMGVPARSFQGWQLPIRTDPVHGRARIREVEAEALRQTVEAGQVAVVAGFQGLSPAGRVTTLGRGGSDTTAVALAAALGGGSLRHLHGCRWRLYLRPPDRAARPQDRPHRLRGDAGDGEPGRESAADALGGARHAQRRCACRCCPASRTRPEH